MVSKEELRKLNKEQLVDLVYDLLIRVDKLLAEVQDLKEEVKRLKHRCPEPNTGSFSTQTKRTAPKKLEVDRIKFCQTEYL